MNEMFRYDAIPTLTLDSLDRYVKYGLEPGSFLMSVLTNDLFGAVGRADAFNLSALPQICTYIYNELPRSCFGNSEIVQNWMKEKRQ